MMKWAALFPGQGSQHVGMGKDLFDNFKVAQHTYEEGSDALKLDLKKLCFEGPDDDLKLTFNSQPCLLVTSIAAWRVFTSECDARPTVGLGHSLGEYSALVAASALSLSDALQTVRVRGLAMQESVPVGVGGMMAVIGMDDGAVHLACGDFQKRCRDELGLRDCVVEVANLNSPGQVVISGHQKVLDFMKENIKGAEYNAARVKMIPLAVSAPFHSSLMKPAAEKLKVQLEKVHWQNPMKFPVINNLSANPNSDSAKLVGLLYDQMTQPVLWTASIQDCGVTTFAEFGAGRVLSGLVKKILPEPHTFNIDVVENLKVATQGLRS